MEVTNQEKEMRNDTEEHDRDWDLLKDVEEPLPDYNNSGPLDIHLYSTDPQVEKAAQNLCSEINYKLDRAVTHMKVLILNLYWTHHLSPDRWIGYSRNNSKKKIHIRYNCQGIAVHPLLKVVNGLEKHGYLTNQKGYFDRATRIGKCSKIQATQKLIDLLESKYGLTIDVVGRHPNEEVIYLKDKNKELVWYEDNRETPKMRKFLHEYNEFLQKTYIDIDYMGYVHERRLVSNSPEYLAKLPTHLYFDLTKRKMRRVFNNESFKQGGRFYGGFWMEMPGKLRLRLIIESQKVVEVDYSGMHVHLLYNQVGIDYGRKNQDPYEIPEYPESPEYRNLFKKLLLAAINAESPELARDALQKDINFNRADYPGQIPDLMKVIDDFKEYHDPIANKLFTGAGLKLMYQDSQIAEHVMKSMMQSNIPVLPVHDSFICPKRNSDELIDAMIDAHRNITGRNLPNVKYTVNIKEPSEWDRSNGNELFPDEDYYYTPEYTEDYELIQHMIQVDGYHTIYGDDTIDLIENRIATPNKLHIKVPIQYMER
ncbi:hypothetical protein [Geobacter sulfurreducens]|uniref:hypothetical protein n=1 Tax=Geobacter sulfurreducens TaxID=35554 RepID=UPI000DBAE655|nr:hypothetical protein [Geobacter sulfurreducens]BBA71033.1 hypothetical protein YM18_2515 [Geobacter sulfurreducens]